MSAEVRQTLIGVGLAVCVVSVWVCLHVYAVCVFVPRAETPPVAAAIVALLCWLNAGPSSSPTTACTDR